MDDNCHTAKCVQRIEYWNSISQWHQRDPFERSFGEAILKLVLRHFLAGVLLAFLPSIAPIASETAAAADAQPVKAARDAHQKLDREDLAAPLRETGEVRVIVGLETRAGTRAARGAASGSGQEQAVSARQSRVLQRLAGHNLRKVKRLRHHHFIALTVDAAALAALLADPEVTSVTEDRPVYPVLSRHARNHARRPGLGRRLPRRRSDGRDHRYGCRQDPSVLQRQGRRGGVFLAPGGVNIPTARAGYRRASVRAARRSVPGLPAAGTARTSPALPQGATAC